MGSLNDFTKRIKVVAKNVEGNTDKTVQKVATVIDRLVVSETPVDQGTARSNWLVSRNSPRTDKINAYAPGQKGSTGAQNTQAALSQGAAEINARKHGEDVYITNNLPYIGLLNSGSSQQAPAGFVEKAVEAASVVVNNTKVLK